MPARETTAHERDVLERACAVLPGGSQGNVYYDLVVREGRGSRVWDLSGNEYVDYLLGSGPMLIGHAHPEVVEAVKEQAARGFTFFALNELAVLLAEEIASAVPCAGKVRFLSSGTEATHYAMRAARAFRGRDKILKFEGGFHGMNDYSLMSMWPTDPPDFPYAAPDSPGIPASVQAEMLIAPFNDIETTTAIIERYHDELAGVIVEPFQRVIPPRPGFLEGLREITEQYELPLIFDEIVTGFRFAYGGAQEYYGVTPDLCTLGKVVAGGFPLSAVAGRDEIMEHFDPTRVEQEGFMPQIGTLSGVGGGTGDTEGAPARGHLREAVREWAASQGRPAAAAGPGRDTGAGGWRLDALRCLLHRRGDSRLPLDTLSRQGQGEAVQPAPARARRLQGRHEVLRFDRPRRR